MTATHLYLQDAGASVPDRWMQAFPQGLPLEAAALHQRVRSHSLAHGIVWLPATGHEPWQTRVAALLSLQQDLKMVLLSGVPTEEEALLAIRGGVRGYAHSHAVPALLQEVALVVQHGGLWLGPELMRRLVQATAGALMRQVAPQTVLDDSPAQAQRTRRGSAKAGPASRPAAAEASPGVASVRAAWDLLTSREREIAHSVTRGQSNKEIAALMRISEKTVKAHLGAVFQKLGVRDRLQLVVRMAAVNTPSDT